jgi:hypothetical protein
MQRIIAVLFALLFFSSFAEAQQQFQAGSQINVKSYISVNNTTAVAVKTTGGTVYQVDAYNNGASVAYVKLYNATSTTCGSGTPMARYLIPYGTSSSGGGFVTPNINGDALHLVFACASQPALLTTILLHRLLISLLLMCITND